MLLEAPELPPADCKRSSNARMPLFLLFQQTEVELCKLNSNSADRLTGVEHHLESEFRLFQRRRDVVGRNAEARLGNVRFLGELVKFRLIPFGAVLSRLKVRLGPTS
jgi:hypothetical protein